MLFDAKNGSVPMDGGRIDYIRFGCGGRTLVLLPGVSDGLKTVRGMALPFALLYRALTKDFTVYSFSRRDPLPAGQTTREMARELGAALDALGVRRAAVVGVSQGGMVAQWLAADRPELAEKLVLAVSAARPNETLTAAVNGWLAMAARGDYAGIMIDTAKRSYTEARLRRVLPGYRLLGLAKPRDFSRFITAAEACLTHDASAALGRIACPTLIVGGTDDRIVTACGSEELAEGIPGSELILYKGLSHGLYEEAPDFWARVAAFCR